MQDLRVTLVQSMLHWEDAAANRTMFAELMADLEGKTDLVVLPEMFTTGFTMRSQELAEPMNGPSLVWMKLQAARTGAAIYGSVIVTEGGRFFNRGLFVKPDGGVTIYDKRHLFRMAEERDHYSAGHERVIVEWSGWRLLLQVCYDLRFPVFSRARCIEGKADYDAVVYVANWPETRRYAWSQLLIARAIENQAYVLGVNRVGMDGKGVHYAGDSVVVDPRGSVVGTAASVNRLRCALEANALLDFRMKFPAILDADDFILEG